MIEVPANSSTYKRPPLPSDDDLAPEPLPPTPPTNCERIILFLHMYHRVYTATMFVLCIAFLLWGGMHGINMRDPLLNTSQS